MPPPKTPIIGRLRATPAPAAQPTPPAPEPPGKRQKGIASVETAIDLLRIIEAAGQPIALKDIAAAGRLSTAAAHHYLVSLVRTGLVRQNPANSHYELGQYALQLGLTALRGLDLVETASDALRQLRDQTGESCFFSVWGSHGATIVKYLEGIHAVTVEVRLGLVLPLLGSATGAVYLTWLPDAILKPMLDQEAGATPASRTKQVRQIRTQVRQDGMGLTQGGLLPRIAALASPVFRHDDELAGVLTVLGWNDELDLAPDGVPARILQQQARDVSARLGHLPSRQLIERAATPAQTG